MAAPQPLLLGYDDPEALSPMGACGDSYRMLVTNSEGRTAGDPCGAYCNAADQNLWNAAARSMDTTKVQVAWDIYVETLKATKTNVDPGLHAQYNAFKVAVAGLMEADTFAFPETYATHVADATSAMELGACVLERIEEETKALGAKGVATPGTTAPSGGGLGTIFGLPWWVIALGVGAVVVARR